ncbi:MAG TPA: hypothetical protein VMS65_05210 [Polyangiaceae bacterium]|nr:hypothetical protein [Polyangiaceae bacterium]
MDGLVRAVTRAGFVAVGVVTAFACGGPQEPAEEGEDCYRDADCKLGLVCVPQGSSRKCSDEIGGLISQVPQPPPDAGMPVDDAGGEPPVDGG